MNSVEASLPTPESHADFVRNLVKTQLNIYRLQPMEMVSHFNREESVVNSYRGRQVLELLQNADDAGANYAGDSRVLLSLSERYLAVANTGEPFSRAGFESLMISDNSPKQLYRSQCIGNKGLGFRSVLSWTSTPLVLSGDNAIVFSAEKAHELASQLTGEVAALRKKFDEWMESQSRLPVPTMRFPFVPEADDPWLRIASSIKDRGYDSVILLPLLPGKYDEVLSQFRDLSGETALFCHHLKELTIEATEVAETWHVDRDPENDGVQPAIITHRGEPRLWNVHRRMGHVSKDVLDERLRETPSYEIAVAVPDRPEPGVDHKLCVFFPTDDSLPMAMLAHATLETDDNRKRLTNHPANREVLGHLAELIADVLEFEASNSSPARAFALLAGVERCDGELKAFGFVERVLAACRQKRIFQRLDGQRTNAASVRVATRPIWRTLARPEVFPEMFAVEQTDANELLIAALTLATYTEEELSKRLETLVYQMTPADAGTAVGLLLEEHAIPHQPRAALLRDEAGAVIPAERTVFLPPEGQSVALPAWARNRISVLHAEFADAMRKQLRRSTVRDIRSRLQIAGYRIEEFRFETLARRLEEVATEETDGTADAPIERCRDVLRCLFDLSGADEDLAVIKASMRVITTQGSLRRADQCYFGPDFEGERLAYDLYQSLGEDEFVSSINALGLTGRASGQIVEFLKRLGVLGQPRTSKIAGTDLSRHGLSKLVEATLAEALDLSAAFGPGIETPAAVQREFHEIIIEGIQLPDRFLALLHEDNVESLIKFLGGAGAVLLSQMHAPDAELQAKHGSQRVHRSYQLRVPNPVTFLLKNESWVPCSDGGRRRPEQIILHKLGSIVFEGTFFTHVIGNDRGIAGRSLADSVLLRLGAVYSLEALRPAEMYRLLEDLPNRDPKGVNAPGIYRSLLEHAAPSGDTPERQAFLARGMLWGRLNDQPAYYPVAQLRYSSRGSLPAPVKKLIPLVEIDTRRKTSEVERIFGVQQVKQSDVILTVDKTTIESCPWSCFASERLTQALPYLYACRLARKADEDGRDRRRLGAASICVCRHFRVAVTVEGVAREDITCSSELDGLVIDQTVFLVSLRPEMPRMSQSFWRAVGDLLAELVDAAVGGDFASILACEAPDDMRDLLQRISDGRADELLADAHKRLAMDPSIESVSELLIVPPAPPVSSKVSDPAAATTGEDPSASRTAGTELGTGSFQATEAPVARPPRRIRFSAGAPAARGGKRVVQVTDEAESLNIATRYEEQDNRFTIPVNHIHGYEGPRCDLLSVNSEGVRDRALQTRSIRLEDVARFIEVKGRNQRTGAVELTENELSGAEKFGPRFFIYRVFCDATDPRLRELAILGNPISSPTRQVSTTIRFQFNEGSGASWFALMFDAGEDEATQPVVN